MTLSAYMTALTLIFSFKSISRKIFISNFTYLSLCKAEPFVNRGGNLHINSPEFCPFNKKKHNFGVSIVTVQCAVLIKCFYFAHVNLLYLHSFYAKFSDAMYICSSCCISQSENKAPD